MRALWGYSNLAMRLRYLSWKALRTWKLSTSWRQITSDKPSRVGRAVKTLFSSLMAFQWALTRVSPLNLRGYIQRGEKTLVAVLEVEMGHHILNVEGHLPSARSCRDLQDTGARLWAADKEDRHN